MTTASRQGKGGGGHPNTNALPCRHNPHQPSPSQRSSAPNNTTPNNPSIFPTGSNDPLTPLMIVVSDGGFVDPVASALPEFPVGDATVHPLATHPTRQPGQLQRTYHHHHHPQHHYHHSPWQHTPPSTSHSPPTSSTSPPTSPRVSPPLPLVPPPKTWSSHSPPARPSPSASPASCNHLTRPNPLQSPS